jgi:adenine-specific DNA methylase
MQSGFYDDLVAAATDASHCFGIPVDSSDLLELVNLGLLPSIPDPTGSNPRLRPDDVRRLAGNVFYHAELDGLFVDLDALFQRQHRSTTERVSRAAAAREGDVVFIQLSPTLGLSFILGSAETDQIQLLVASLRHEEAAFSRSEKDPLVRTLNRIDVHESVAIWSLDYLPEQEIRLLWEKSISTAARISHAETLTVPSLYGNKSRITSFLAAVARQYVPDGGSICDLMSGTGIAARTLSHFFDVYANDANPFAALLTRSHKADLSSVPIATIISTLQASYGQNATALRDYLGEALEMESGFINGEIDDNTLLAYQGFCRDTSWHRSNTDREVANRAVSRCGSEFPSSLGVEQLLAERAHDPKVFPYCMVSAYYSNAYFGVAQSIALDSLRFAIDCCPDKTFRDFCLAALLVTACSCASGPHFAQPPRANSQRNMAKLLEHRARDVATEFFLILGLMIERQKQETSVRKVWNLDWREALNKFLSEEALHGPIAIYVDPPYTKLQYSRYYHVLDSLVRFDYPGVSGVGRYPPMRYRFSSRFEYQRASALREFRDLFKISASSGAVLLLSYTNSGMVPLEQLIKEMSEVYSRVDLFCKRIVHHSQGVKVPRERQLVLEYVVAGSTR